MGCAVGSFVGAFVGVFVGTKVVPASISNETVFAPNILPVAF